MTGELTGDYVESRHPRLTSEFIIPLIARFFEEHHGFDPLADYSFENGQVLLTMKSSKMDVTWFAAKGNHYEIAGGADATFFRFVKEGALPEDLLGLEHEEIRDRLLDDIVGMDLDRWERDRDYSNIFADLES